MKFGRFFVSVILFFMLAACGQDTKDITVKEDTDKQEETKKEDETKAKEQEESKLGSRTNPVPYQKTATVDDELYNDNGDAFPIKFDLTVTEVTRGDAAFQKLKAMN
ncbi:hypothetical protein QFZ87_003041 [Bacillus sp. SLBN-46]|uniref:hypothetical protein n=1 Tax=Bacillus sp. SLBN-46 TaxID=3042283 RepID=UPI0028624D47|nr:hypothetical protein [Bacillus sp. SLBN-46]MDR6123444.1 hypothetical protein [Bacillus sp. SLBN-46]